jgi:uncharacterized protein Smg (DUF494 family)
LKTRVLEAVSFIGRFFADYGHEDSFEVELSEALMDQGFSDSEVKDAYRWIEEKTLGTGVVGKKGLYQGPRFTPPLRVLTEQERLKLSPEAYGILIDLHFRGVFDILIVEEILLRAMALKRETVRPVDIKRLAALIVFTQMQEDWADLLSLDEDETLIQ